MAMFSELGRTLALLRVERSLTQAQLAERAEVARSNVSAYEGGEIKPQLDTLERLLKALGLGLEDFVKKIREVQALAQSGPEGEEVGRGLDRRQGEPLQDEAPEAYIVVPIHRGQALPKVEMDLVARAGRQAARVVDELYRNKKVARSISSARDEEQGESQAEGNGEEGC